MIHAALDDSDANMGRQAVSSPRIHGARKTVVVIGNGMVGLRFCEKLVEFDTTQRLFTTPRRQETEDYITGRFG